MRKMSQQDLVKQAMWFGFLDEMEQIELEKEASIRLLKSIGSATRAAGRAFKNELSQAGRAGTQVSHAAPAAETVAGTASRTMPMAAAPTQQAGRVFIPRPAKPHIAPVSKAQQVAEKMQQQRFIAQKSGATPDQLRKMVAQEQQYRQANRLAHINPRIPNAPGRNIAPAPAAGEATSVSRVLGRGQGPTQVTGLGGGTTQVSQILRRAA